ncbi:MAG TPA: 5-oxoprolinase subunit PxpB, partial [Trueperaceae bacterium]|nr:5-oxoprolinase subunit PxpB [Trueperaceae bacterium]
MKLAGIYKQFSDKIDADKNAQIHAFGNKLRQDLLPGVSDIIPSYCNIYIEYDSQKLSKQHVEFWLANNLENLDSNTVTRTVKIPVDYSGEDLEYISQETALTKKEIIKKHSEKIYQVYAMGFMPGFAFMAEVEPSLRLPRRGVPRLVPAGSVAMANAQTSVYPFASPGGWHILGQALVALYDPNRAEPFLLQAGDKVEFVAAAPQTLAEVKTLELLEPTRTASFRVLATGLLDLLLDQGRFLSGHLGLSRTGALDAKLANLANSLLGNSKNAVILEINLLGPKLEVINEVLIVFVGYALQLKINNIVQEAFKTILLKAGDIISFSPLFKAGPSYLAVQ